MAATLATGADRRHHGLRRWLTALRGTRHGGVVLYGISVALVAVGYYLAGRIGLELAYLNGAVAALWPPAGFGLAVLFLYGVRLWPGIVSAISGSGITRRRSGPSSARRWGTRWRS